MTQTSKILQVPASQVTAQILRNADLNVLRVIRTDGTVYGENGVPSLHFGLGSYEGDFDGFAAHLRTA